MLHTDGPFYTQPRKQICGRVLPNLNRDFDRQESLDASIPAGVKHVDSDGSGIFSPVISDAASFPGLPLEARAHDRTIRGWWWA